MVGLLPYDQEVEVRSNPDGEPLATVQGQIRPLLGSFETDRGERYDYEGELEPAAAEYVVGTANRQLVVDDEIYKVVAAVEWTFLPHVQVSLLQLRPGG